jgi:hypothetical protein
VTFVNRKIMLLLVFAVAMGYLEASVVVYLRGLFYPEGFGFPLKIISIRVGVIELAREAATLVILLSAAWIAERTRRGRFAAFMFLFGVWDITYYLWLWVTLSWPSSLLTWDLLFLIPVIWTGPVIAPVVVSILLITTSLLYFARRDGMERVRISGLEWALAVAAAGIIFAAFALNHGAAYGGRVPSGFPWEIFGAGVVIGVVILVRVSRRLTCRDRWRDPQGR